MKKVLATIVLLIAGFAAITLMRSVSKFACKTALEQRGFTPEEQEEWIEEHFILESILTENKG